MSTQSKGCIWALDESEALSDFIFFTQLTFVRADKNLNELTGKFHSLFVRVGCTHHGSRPFFLKIIEKLPQDLQARTIFRKFRFVLKETKNEMRKSGPDVIRTHDLPVISRAHHRAMLRAQKFALNLP